MFNMSNFNLEQGKKILNYNESIDDLVKPHLQLIEKGSIVEAMSNNYFLSNIDKKTLEGLQNNENEFNQTLAEYNQTYKMLSEDILNKTQSNKQIVNYLGKVISDNDGNNYYVNNFGFTHKYSQGAWDGNNESCSNTAISYTGNMSDFQTGMNMNTGQPCGIAGQIVKNTDTSEEAWVDIKGVKHAFSESKPSNCASTPIELNASDYNLIPTGNPMKSTQSCVALDVNPTLWARLEALNTKLKNLAKNTVNEISGIELESEELNGRLIKRQQELLSYIDQISTDRKSIEYSTNNLVDVNAEDEDANIRMTYNYSWYLVWILIMVLVISLTMKNMGSSSGSTDKGTMVIVAIFLLIFVLYAIKKISSMNVTISM